MQCLDVAREPALGFKLQEAGDVRLGQFRHFEMGRQRPFQRQTDHAVALPHPGGVEVVPDLASDQLGVIGQRVERQ